MSGGGARITCAMPGCIAFTLPGKNFCKPCGDVIKGNTPPPQMREFSGGATRDLDDTKLNYRRCLSPQVTKRYLEYMQGHRQTTGGLRDWDNWKQGIPQDVYLDSLVRHVKELELMTDILHQVDTHVDIYEDTLCAIMFNVQGLLLESWKQHQDPPFSPAQKVKI